MVEGAAVLVGILLAFGIEAWWQERGDREREAAYTSALLQEVQQNRAIYDEKQARLAAQIDETDHYFESVIFASDRVSGDTILAMLWSIGVINEDQSERAALTDLLSSGGLAYLESDTTRRLVARYERLLNLEAKRQAGLFADFTDNILPYLVEHGSLSDMTRDRLHGESANLDGMHVGTFEIDHEAFVWNRTFGNLVTSQLILMGNYSDTLRDLLAGIDELTQDLENTNPTARSR